MKGRAQKHRRALTNIGGEVELWGADPVEAEIVERALDVREGEGAREHIHGFHSYPARMHPATAQRLIARLSKPGQLVLDPFCGSGTILVEGRLLGRMGVGVDANPLAVELATLKTAGSTEEDRAAIVAGARLVAASADDRRKRRAGATKRYPPADTSLFDPHVLLELDGLRAGFAAVAPEVRRALRLVLSSILVKVSRRPGDTATAEAPRRLASGFTLRLFVNKTEELARLLAQFGELLPADAPPPPIIRVGDARKLDGIRDASVDLVVTSPPYPGNYDYLSHHAVRLRWLDLDADHFAKVELGARRHLEPLPPRAAGERWAAELGATLAAMSRVLTPTGKIVLILADSVIGHRAVYADRLVSEIAPLSRLRVTTIGSQARPHFHGPSARAFDRAPRREHAIVLRRGGENPNPRARPRS